MERLLVTGGGTGGHITPALALAEAFLAAGPGRRVLYLGSRSGREVRAAAAAGIDFAGIPARGFRGKSIAGRFLFLTTLLRGFLAAHRALGRFRPDAVLATGSYVSLPVILAAKLRGTPVFLQEQNSLPGSVNRLAARWARAVFIAFPEARRFFGDARQVEELGNPLRSGFRAEAAHGGGERPSILITGGSQGARTLCLAATGALPLLAERHEFSAVVQTGEAEYQSTREALSKLSPRVEVHGFIEDMAGRMAGADLVIARAGAMTLAEITALGRPSILVPFPHATDDHQTANARSLASAGAAILIPDIEMDGPRLLRELESLLGDPRRLARMGEASAVLGRPEAAARIIEAVENVLARRPGR